MQEAPHPVSIRRSIRTAIAENASRTSATMISIAAANPYRWNRKNES